MHVCRLRAQTGRTQRPVLVLQLPAAFCHDPRGPLPILYSSSSLQLQSSGVSCQRCGPPKLSAPARSQHPWYLPEPEHWAYISKFSKYSQQAAEPPTQRVSSLHAQPVPPSIPYTRDKHPCEVHCPGMERSFLTGSWPDSWFFNVTVK